MFRIIYQLFNGKILFGDLFDTEEDATNAINNSTASSDDYKSIGIRDTHSGKIWWVIGSVLVLVAAGLIYLIK